MIFLATLPYIPENITVHLGAPDDTSAPNVTVPFVSYIENVASGEIYPTWPDAALRANIYAQISFALNKIYLEFYRSRGYNFDITGTTAYDQSYVQGRNVFENISDIVYEIFNTYIRRQDSIEPLAAKFCNGTTTTCDGLSQWGTVDLANQGLGAYDILVYYYGDDIVLNFDTPVMGIIESYPGTALRLGDNRPEVYTIEYMLNLISTHYPIIPKIYPLGYDFNENVDNAVRVFQETFNLTVDGIVGRNTWYRMVYLFTGIERLTELHSEGVSLEGTPAGGAIISATDSDRENIIMLQYYLAVISQFYTTIPSVTVTGEYNEETNTSVTAFQRQFNLPVTGVINEETYDYIYRVYITLVPYVDEFSLRAESFSGRTLSFSEVGEEVKELQRELGTVLKTDLYNSGIYGRSTAQNVAMFQRNNNLKANGIADSHTKEVLGREYIRTVTSLNPKTNQYPGYDLKKGMEDKELKRTNQTLTTPVRYLQRSLRDIGYIVIPDGVFGDRTYNAITDIQRKNNLSQTGEADFETYNKIRTAHREVNKK
jgi:peptidoglycan hydrolase-like protein with peptidoglycan-binding domain